MARDVNFARDVREKHGKLENRDNEDDEGEFLVSYQNRFYDIRNFLKYHPGGKKVFDYFKYRSLDKAFDKNPHSKSAFHLLEDFTLNSQEKYQKYEVSYVEDTYFTRIRVKVSFASRSKQCLCDFFVFLESC